MEAIEAIERYAEQDKASFRQDELLQTWFLYHLRIIGEAVTRDVPALKSPVEELLRSLERRDQ